jgi:Tfp pilus assembly protein PilN
LSLSPSFMEVNLLPYEKAQDKYRFGIRLGTMGLLTILTVAFTILGGVQHAAIHASQQDIQKTQEDLSTVSQKLLPVDAKLHDIQAKETLTQSVGFQPFVKSLLERVAQVMPSGVTVTDVQITDNLAVVTGTAQTLTELAQFQDSVTSVANVSGVWMQNTGQTSAGDGSLSFVVNLQLSGGQHP